MDEEKKIQEMVNTVLKESPEIQFKTCKICGKNFPAHEWFFNKHPKSHLGFEARCKECVSLSKGRKYKITSAIEYPWHHGKEEEFIKMFRIMADYQLAEYFNVNISDIKNTAKKLNIKMSNIVGDLRNDEIIYIYNSIYRGKRKCFPNGIYSNINNKIIIFRYIIDDVLKWNREDICNNINTNTLKEFKIDSMIVDGTVTLYDLLILTFPDYEIRKWELKKSSVGEWDNNSVSEALIWLKDKLLRDKGIDNINFAGTYSFKNLLDEYNLNGLCNVRFSGSSVLLFEKTYNKTFSKEEMLKDNYTFNIDINCVPKTLEGKVYKLTDSYNSLDDRGKTLVNEVVRFCENENGFPNEKDLSNQTGYICRTQFYKYFGENTLKQLYDYIIPVYDLSEETDVGKFRNIIDGQNYNIEIIKPNKIACIQCREVKEFTEENFSKHEEMKFGLNYTCKKCENKHISRLHYKQKGVIEFDEFEDITPEEWWEYVQNGNIRYLPEFCLEEKNAKRIIRYVLLDKLKLSREEIKTINREFLKKYNIGHLYGIFFKTRLNFLNVCFPELEINDYELDRLPYDEEMINAIISNWVKDNNISILNILNNEADYRNNSKIYNMLMNTFISKYDMFIWYFKKNNIRHPTTNDVISVEDFDRMPPNYWSVLNNRIKHVRKYCEENGITECLNDTDMLKRWVFNNFRQEVLPSQIQCFNMTLYETLMEAYPNIKENKLLFDWEWNQFSESDKQTLIRMLRELIEFRLDKYIINYITDIPTYINGTFIKSIYPKFQHQIAKKRFDTYYQWCCEAYPEYADNWKPEDFGLCVAFDGTRCGSIEEKIVYEFFKGETGLDIEAIGFKKSGEHVFILPDEHEDNKYCPDFVAHKINNNGNIIVFEKPLYIEYYGWYTENHQSQIFIDYKNKTDRKNEFYKKNSDILFLDIYPCDLKDNFKFLKAKYNKLKQLAV